MLVKEVVPPEEWACADWVQSHLNGAAQRRRKDYTPVTLTPFQRKAIGILVVGFGTGVYNLPINWSKVDWGWGNGVKFNIRCGSASSYDFDHLTRLVLAAHKYCVRLSIEPSGPGMLGIVLHPRQREGDSNWARHPTIEQAIERFEKTSPRVAP